MTDLYLPDDLDEFADVVLLDNLATRSRLVHIAPASPDGGTLRIVAADGAVLWQLRNVDRPVSQADELLAFRMLATEHQWSPRRRSAMSTGAGGEVEPPLEHDSLAAAPSFPADGPMGGMILALAVMVAVYAAIAWWLL
jgi:ferric-dicitrate binding protein FerR (iron transport regulator)